MFRVLGVDIIYSGAAHRRQVRVAREEMPAPSSWEQPLRFSVDSAVSSDSGARSALHQNAHTASFNKPQYRWQSLEGK